MSENNGKSMWRPRAFDRIRGNFKTEYDYAIGAKTLIIGANQSGKSGVLIGARYSLLGTAAWTIGVHGSEVAGFAPKNAVRLWNELAGPDGSAMWEAIYDQADQKWAEPEKKPIWKGAIEQIPVELRKNVLPLATMSELLFYGADRGRRAVINRFGDRSALDPIKLLPDQKALWEEVRVAATKKLTKLEEGVEVLPDASEVLVQMNKDFAKIKRDEGAKIKQLQKSIDERMPLLIQQAAGSEQIPTLRAQLERAVQWESAHALRERLARIEKEKEIFRADRERLQLTPEALSKREAAEKGAQAEHAAAETTLRETATAEIKTCEAEVTRLDSEIVFHKERLIWGEGLIATLNRAQEMRHQADAQAETCLCPICKNPFDPAPALEMISPMVAQRRAILEETTSRRDRASKQIASVRSALESALSAHRAKVAQWEQQVAKEKEALNREAARLRQEHTRIMTAEEEIKKSIAAIGAPATYTGAASAELRAEIDRLENAAKSRKTLEDETENVRNLDVIRTRAKTLEEEAKKILDLLVAQVKEKAELTVNKYILDGPPAVLDLEKNAWRIIDNKGEARSRHTMCGLEEDFLIPGLAAAYSEEAPLRALILDDRDIAGVGTENAERFFRALGNAVDKGWLTQVIVAGNRLEAVIDRIAALGWMVVRTDVALTAPVQVPVPAVDPLFAPNPFSSIF